MPPVLPSLGALIGGSGLVSLGLIPLFVMGLTFFRYSAVDPESRPIDTKQVRSTLGTFTVSNLFMSLKQYSLQPEEISSSHSRLWAYEEWKSKIKKA